MNPPWGGHGFNTSVGDAVNIAWKIAAVERGWAAPGLLASYEAERRGVAEQTVASAAANMTALAGDLPADAAVIQRVKRFEFYSLGLVLGYSYAGSPVIQPGPAVVKTAVVSTVVVSTGASTPAAVADPTTYTPAAEPGARLPHAWLPDGTSLYDRLGPGFTLVGPAGGGAALAARARERGIPLTVAAPPPGYRWRDEFLLVRPDQHIAWRAGDPDDIDLDLVTGRSSAPAGRLALKTAHPHTEAGT